MNRDRTRDFIGVALPDLVYIGITDRAEFDRIDADVKDHRENKFEKHNLLTKNVESDRVHVIFQHWLDT